jgi:hypothetical protein
MTAGRFRPARKVAAQLRGRDRNLPVPRFHWGELTAVSNTAVSVMLSGDTTVLTGIAYLGAFEPKVGDHVLVLANGPDKVVLGPLAPLGTHSGTFSATTDASGFITVTHGAGFTPTKVHVTTTVQISGTPNTPSQNMTDSYGATTFRVRVWATLGTVLNAVSVQGVYTCWR